MVEQELRNGNWRKVFPNVKADITCRKEREKACKLAGIIEILEDALGLCLKGMNEPGFEPLNVRDNLESVKISGVSWSCAETLSLLGMINWRETCTIMKNIDKAERDGEGFAGECWDMISKKEKEAVGLSSNSVPKNNRSTKPRPSLSNNNCVDLPEHLNNDEKILHCILSSKACVFLVRNFGSAHSCTQTWKKNGITVSNVSGVVNGIWTYLSTQYSEIFIKCLWPSEEMIENSIESEDLVEWDETFPMHTEYLKHQALFFINPDILTVSEGERERFLRLLKHLHIKPKDWYESIQITEIRDPEKINGIITTSSCPSKCRLQNIIKTALRKERLEIPPTIGNATRQHLSNTIRQAVVVENSDGRNVLNWDLIQQFPEWRMGNFLACLI